MKEKERFEKMKASCETAIDIVLRSIDQTEEMMWARMVTFLKDKEVFSLFDEVGEVKFYPSCFVKETVCYTKITRDGAKLLFQVKGCDDWIDYKRVSFCEQFQIFTAFYYTVRQISKTINKAEEWRDNL